jgi:GTP-binding protein
MTMFVDQLTIYAKAGDGGDGVTRWRHDKFKPMAGPAGGNGGGGGDIFLRAVRDVNLLAKYTGSKNFAAENGGAGMGGSCHGKNGEDLIIDIPMGSVVHDRERSRVYEFMTEGHIEKVFKGGGGGLGNEHFKSSTNRSPEESTPGRAGEEGELEIALSLVVDVGFIGMPNAGKSTLLNSLTNAHSKIGAFPFTTTEPHLGDFYGFILADIPGLIEGASSGKGLGHTFLRHVTRTKMLLHLVSLETEDAVERYNTIRKELSTFSKDLATKEEWILLTKKDLVKQEYLDEVLKDLDTNENRVFVISVETGDGLKEFQDSLVQRLRQS